MPAARSLHQLTASLLQPFKLAALTSRERLANQLKRREILVRMTPKNGHFECSPGYSRCYQGETRSQTGLAGLRPPPTTH